MKSFFVATVILVVGGLVTYTLWNQTQSSHGLSAAQEIKSGQSETSPITPDTAAKDETVAHSLISASSLQGATLMGKNQESVGKVARVALTAGTQNVHLVVNVGGVLGIGAREIAIPLSAIRLQPSTEPEDTSVWLGINASNEQLSQAPPLEARDSLELTDMAWVKKNAQFFGLEPKVSDQAPQSADKLPVLTVDQLLDQAVVGEGDTATIATLSDILFGFEETAIEYAILSYGGTLGIGKKYVAIPFRQLSIERHDEGKVHIAIPHNSKTLAEQQHVTPSDYPELKLQSVRLRIAQ